MPAPELYVTNFNKNFTGVSATAAGVVGVQQGQFDLRLVGHDLPKCPAAIGKKAAYSLSKKKPADRHFAIWHVRRNPEMRAALWARDVLKYPIKIVFTSAAQRYHSMYPRWLISKMDAVIATTQEAEKYVPNVHAVVPHGVNTARFRPSIDRAADWRSLGFGGTIGVATVGRVRPEKGTDIFVDAMLEVLPKHPELVAVVIGKAAREHRGFLAGLKQKVMDQGLGDRLLFPGEMDADNMPKLMRSISLLVALPRYEGYGVTPLEAMASGAPFVGSQTGYFSEFSDNGSFGTVVELDSAHAGADAINTWLSDGDKLVDASAKAPAFVKNMYSIEKEAAGIATVYDNLWNGVSNG